MKLTERLREYVSFTKNEQKILLFLAAIFLVGAGIKGYRAYVAPPPPEFDYKASDSVFNERSAASATALLVQQKININAATAAELESLPGIGPAMAAQILSYRAAHGRFSTIDELRQVKGIGPKKLEKIQPFVRLQ
jgi:comEA protein